MAVELAETVSVCPVRADCYCTGGLRQSTVLSSVTGESSNELCRELLENETGCIIVDWNMECVANW